MKMLKGVIIFWLATLPMTLYAGGGMLTQDWLKICEADKDVCFLIFTASTDTASFTDAVINEDLKARGTPAKETIELFCNDKSAKYKRGDLFNDFHAKMTKTPFLHTYPFGMSVAYYLNKTFPTPC